MSSSHRQVCLTGCLEVIIVAHPTVDLVADAPAEGPDGLGLGVAGGHALGEVVATTTLESDLGDRDAMQGQVELAVPGTRESMTAAVGRPDGHRRRAVVAGEGGGTAEALDAGRLAHELGRGERPAARESQERRRQVGHEAADLALQAVDGPRQLADASHQVEGDAGDGTREAGEADLERLEDVAAVEAAGCWLLARMELVEVPAQAGLGPGALGDEVVAVVDEETQLALGTIQAGDRQVRLTQGCPGDRERVDGVALAWLAPGAAGPGHELGRHAHDRLARDDEVALETTGEVAAVLEGPAALGEAGLRPGEELEMTVRRRRDGALGQLPAVLIDGHDGVAALVKIGPERHHVRVSFLIREVDHGPVGGHA